MLSKKLNEMLKVRDMTISDLARLSGISKGALSEMANGKRETVTTDTLQKISKALRIHPAYFLETKTIGTGDLISNIVDEEDRMFILSEEGAMWVKLTREAAESGISPEKIKKLIQILKDEA